MAENENAVAPAQETGEETSGQEAGEQAVGQEAGGEVETAAAPQAEAAPEATPEAAPEAPPEEITYHAVEKDGQVTAIWEMQGRKHLRTIDPRSRQGLEILRLYTAEHGE
jgi:hypothetical protein